MIISSRASKEISICHPNQVDVNCFPKFSQKIQSNKKALQQNSSTEVLGTSVSVFLYYP